MAEQVCAAALQREAVLSYNHFIHAIFSVVISIVTLIQTFYALRQLVGKSGLPDSSRIMLISALFYANLHQLAYGKAMYIIFERRFTDWFSDTSDYCIPLETGQDCQMLMTALCTSITGHILIVSGLCIDRLFDIFFEFYNRLRFLPGAILSILVFVCSCASYAVIRSDNPINDHVLYCCNFPGSISESANRFLSICLYLTIVHLIATVFLLYYCYINEKKLKFDVNARFKTRTNIKANFSISAIALSQLVFNLIYTGGVLFMRSNIHLIQLDIYFFIIPWIYSNVYSSTLLPGLILITSKYWNKRKLSIKHLTRKETQEEHMNRLRVTWS